MRLSSPAALERKAVARQSQDELVRRGLAEMMESGERGQGRALAKGVVKGSWLSKTNFSHGPPPAPIQPTAYPAFHLSAGLGAALGASRVSSEPLYAE